MTTTLPTSRIPDPRDAPPLSWGILAPGNIARGFVRDLLRHTDQRVVACGSRSAQRAGDFAREFGIETVWDSYEALVADPAVEAVYVASPHSHHREHALMAIEAGKHVLVEKAFTRNAGEAREVASAARAAGVACMEAMWTRFLPRHDIVRQVLGDGLLGEIESVTADHGQWFAAPGGPGHERVEDTEPLSRLFDPALAGGALLDLGVYPVSFTHFVMGAPTSVMAAGELASTGVDRQVSAVFGYEGRPTQAVVNTTLAARTPTRAVIAGPDARLELDGGFYRPGGVRVVMRHGRELETTPSGPGADAGLAHEGAHFAQLVADGRLESPLMGLDESISVMETLDELRRQVGVRYPGE